MKGPSYLARQANWATTALLTVAVVLFAAFATPKSHEAVALSDVTHSLGDHALALVRGGDS